MGGVRGHSHPGMPSLQQEANPAAASDLLVAWSSAPDLLLCAKHLITSLALPRQPWHPGPCRPWPCRFARPMARPAPGGGRSGTPPQGGGSTSAVPPKLREVSSIPAGLDRPVEAADRLRPRAPHRGFLIVVQPPHRKSLVELVTCGPNPAALITQQPCSATIRAVTFR
jgi:hypothetical protein